MSTKTVNRDGMNSIENISSLYTQVSQVVHISRTLQSLVNNFVIISL